MQPRYSGRWWIDQHGTEWSAFDLWKGTVLHRLTKEAEDDENGVRVYRTTDDELLHLIRIPPPEAPLEKKAMFFLGDDGSGTPSP